MIIVRSAKYAWLQANWRHVTKTPSFGAWNRAWRRMELSSVNFTFSFFFNKCPFKHANVELQPALALSSPAPGILYTFPCGVNVFLFSIVLSFYWVLIVSERLEGRLYFLPTVYWKTVLLTELIFRWSCFLSFTQVSKTTMLAEFRSCFPFSSQIAFFSLLSSSWSESFKIVSSLRNSILSPSPADRRLACLTMVYFREVWCLQMDDCLWCFLRFSSVRGAGESPWLRVIHFFSHCLRLQMKFGLTIKYIFYTYPFHDYFTSILTVEQTRLVTGCVLSYKMISKRKRKVNKRE